MEIEVAGVTITVRDRPDDLWERVAGGDWEPRTIAALSSLARSGLFVDIGAHVGETALVAAALGSYVLAFEPDPVAYDELAANVAMNPWADRVTLVPVALAGRSGTATLTAPGALGDSMSSLDRAPGGASVEVPVENVGEWVHRIASASVVKVDVEGGEYELLPAMRSFIRRKRPNLMLALHAYHLAERVSGLPRGVRGAVRRWLILTRRLRLAWLAGPYRVFYVQDGPSWRQVDRRGWLRYLLRFADGETLLLRHPLRP